MAKTGTNGARDTEQLKTGSKYAQTDTNREQRHSKCLKLDLNDYK